MLLSFYIESHECLLKTYLARESSKRKKMFGVFASFLSVQPAQTAYFSPKFCRPVCRQTAADTTKAVSKLAFFFKEVKTKSRIFSKLETGRSGRPEPDTDLLWTTLDTPR